jgi:hypothetical protein
MMETKLLAWTETERLSKIRSTLPLTVNCFDNPLISNIMLPDAGTAGIIGSGVTVARAGFIKIILSIMINKRRTYFLI